MLLNGGLQVINKQTRRCGAVLLGKPSIQNYKLKSNLTALIIKYEARGTTGKILHSCVAVNY